MRMIDAVIIVFYLTMLFRAEVSTRKRLARVAYPAPNARAGCSDRTCDCPRCPRGNANTQSHCKTHHSGCHVACSGKTVTEIRVRGIYGRIGR